MSRTRLGYLSRHDCDGFIICEASNPQDQKEIERIMTRFSIEGQVTLQVLKIRED